MASCGTCDLCCTLLEIPDLGKSQNERCNHLRDGGGCGVYTDRPLACQAYHCLWLTSQNQREPANRLPLSMRPDRTRVIFSRSGDEEDRTIIFAHVDPATPDAWQQDPVFAKITWLVNARGATVMVVIKDKRVILKRGQPPLFTSEAELAGYRYSLDARLRASAVPIDRFPALFARA